MDACRLLHTLGPDTKLFHPASCLVQSLCIVQLNPSHSCSKDFWVNDCVCWWHFNDVSKTKRKHIRRRKRRLIHRKKWQDNIQYKRDSGISAREGQHIFTQIQGANYEQAAWATVNQCILLLIYDLPMPQPNDYLLVCTTCERETTWMCGPDSQCIEWI